MPAIKPACANSVTRHVAVLGTEATVAREYTRALIRDYAGDCRVTLVGSKVLAAHAEAELAGTPVSDEAIGAEIAPCFRDEGARTDTVVLACTHYPLLIDRLRQLAPRPVAFVDPAPAIARRVNELLGPRPHPNVLAQPAPFSPQAARREPLLPASAFRRNCRPQPAPADRACRFARLPSDRTADTLSFS